MLMPGGRLRVRRCVGPGRSWGISHRNSLKTRNESSLFLSLSSFFFFQAWTSGFGHPCVRFWIFSCDSRRLPFRHLCTTFAVSQPPRECQELAPGWPDLPVGPGEPADAQLSQAGGLCGLRSWEKPHCGGYGTWSSEHLAWTALHTGPELRPLARARSEPSGLSMAGDTCSLGVGRVSVPPRSLLASARQSQ